MARPIQDSITNALIVKPYMLLQYGRILDPAKTADRKAYAIHLKWVTGGYKAGADSSDDADNRRTPAISSRALPRSTASATPTTRTTAGSSMARPRTVCESDCGSLELTPGGELLDASTAIVTDEDQEFAAFLAGSEEGRAGRQGVRRVRGRNPPGGGSAAPPCC